MLMARKKGKRTVPGTSGIWLLAMVWWTFMPYVMVGVLSLMR